MSSSYDKMYHNMLREKMIELSVVATEVFSRMNKYNVKEEEKKIQNKAVKIAGIISSSCLSIGEKVTVSRIAEILGDMEKYSISKLVNPIEDTSTVKYVNYCMVICSGNDNSHHYPLNTPLLCYSKNEEHFCYVRDGNIRMEDCLTQTKILIKPADRSAIRSFFYSLSSKGINDLYRLSYMVYCATPEETAELEQALERGE